MNPLAQILSPVGGGFKALMNTLFGGPYVPDKPQPSGQGIGNTLGQVGNQIGQGLNNINPLKESTVEIGATPQVQAVTTQPSTQPTPSLQPMQLSLNNTIPGFKNWNPPAQYTQLVNNSASKYNVPPSLIASVIQNENGGWSTDVPNRPNYDKNGKITSWDRAFGQINNVAHPEVSDQQAKDPAFVIDFIGRHLQQKYKETGNWGQSVASYNVGNMIGGGEGSGRDANGLGPLGREYLNKAVKNLDPTVLKNLGLQTQY